MMTQYIPQLLTAVGALVVVVNIIVQVIKPFTQKYISTNFVAVSVSMALTLAAFFAWSAANAVPIAWYMIAGAVVLGFFVAYAAMFGFDKLKEALEGTGARTRPGGRDTRGGSDA